MVAILVFVFKGWTKVEVYDGVNAILSLII